MLKTGIVDTFYCHRYGFEKGLARLRAHGYEGIDYQGFVVTETPLYEKDPHEFEEYLKAQYRVIRGEGLTVHQTHGPWRYPPRDGTKKEQDERFEKMCRAIAGTAILECKKFIIHPIMPFSMEDTGREKEMRDQNLNFMEKLCRVGRENGVVVCLENMPMPKLSLAGVPEVLDFVKAINDDSFKMCLDTGHCIVCGQSPAEAVRMIGKEYLYALHVHDNDGHGDYHWNPFMGVIDWEDFGKALYEIRYDGVLSLEVREQPKLPDVLSAYEEIALAHKARYIASLACGENPREAAELF